MPVVTVVLIMAMIVIVEMILVVEVIKIPIITDNHVCMFSMVEENCTHPHCNRNVDRPICELREGKRFDDNSFSTHGKQSLKSTK